MPANSAILSVNAGELSPYLRHRTDFDKQPAGAELFANFIPLPFGGFRKRPGTEHVAALAGATRLEPFQFDEATAYLLAYTATGLTVYGSTGTQKDTVAFTYGDPFAIQFSHINSLLWSASNNFHPQLLTRVADANWTQANVPFSYAPFLDENIDDALELTLEPTLAPGAWANATNYPVGTHVSHNGRQYTCTVAHLSAAGANDNEPRVGKLWATVWRIRYLAAGDSALLTAPAGVMVALSGSIASTNPSRYRLRIERELEDFETDVALTVANTGGYSASVVIQGSWSIITYGDWDGIVTLQLSFDGGTTWEDRREWKSDKTRNVSDEGEEPKRCLARLLWTHDTLASGNKPRAVLSASSAYVEGIVEIEFFSVNYTTAVVVAVTDCEFGATALWTESAFSDRRGYPAAIGVHERRVIFGGTQNNPVSLWASASDDLVNYETGTEADDALFVTLASTRQDPIRWMASQRRLIVGTAGAEWAFGGESGDSPLGPENLLAREYTFHGSAAMPALRMHDAVFFVERQRRRLRELAYQLDRESYAAADLTRLAEHITAGEIVQMAWQNNREPTLWVITGDGMLLSFFYLREERIAAWARHTTEGGLFTSVAVLRDEASGDDVVWCVVNRSGTYHLEKFAAGQQAIQEDLQEGDAPELCYHVDSGVRDAATDEDLQIDTPAHLNGLELDVMADGYLLRLTPAAGKLTLPHAANVVQAGLRISSRLIPLPQDVATERGTSHGEKKRTNALKLSLYKSRGGKIIYRDQTRKIATTTPDTDLTGPPPAVSGWHRVTLPGGHLQDLQFEIRHDTPEPFTVTAMAYEWAVTES